jgi:hypothetical protein
LPCVSAGFPVCSNASFSCYIIAFPFPVTGLWLLSVSILKYSRYCLFGFAFFRWHPDVDQFLVFITLTFLGVKGNVTCRFLCFHSPFLLQNTALPGFHSAGITTCIIPAEYLSRAMLHFSVV